MATDTPLTSIQDVMKRFPTPQSLVETPEFDQSQKVKLLQQWEQDLRLEMVATEENMPGQMPGQGQGGAAETFRKVRAALTSLGVGEQDKPAGASKVGG